MGTWMDRSLWQHASITKLSCPAWECPTCRKATVSLVPKSLAFTETAESSRADRNHESWGPESIEYLFSARAQCRQPACKEQLYIVGKGSVEPEYTGDPDGGWEWE